MNAATARIRELYAEIIHSGTHPSGDEDEIAFHILSENGTHIRYGKTCKENARTMNTSAPPIVATDLPILSATDGGALTSCVQLSIFPSGGK